MLTNVEGNREDSPQSTVQPINLHHIEEPLNCRHISKTVDTHLFVKGLCSRSFNNYFSKEIFCDFQVKIILIIEINMQLLCSS